MADRRRGPYYGDSQMSEWRWDRDNQSNSSDCDCEFHKPSSESSDCECEFHNPKSSECSYVFHCQAGVVNVSEEHNYIDSNSTDSSEVITNFL